MAKEYTVACYYFPNYHVDPRNEAAHGPDWTEWALVKHALARFSGHRQPIAPAWGYGDEADPVVMAQKIDAAADHGIDAFIFDWYWYDDGPFLERALEAGFLGAANQQRLKFSLMWANHDWVDIMPAKITATLAQGRTLYPGAVTRQTWDTVADYIIDRYFSHPAYWLIDGCPYFSIYDLTMLMTGLGGVDAPREAIQALRAKVKRAGFPDLHLNAVVWSVKLLPGEQIIKDPAGLLHALGFDSITSYVWVHHDALHEFPTTDYNQARDRYLAYWDEAERTFDLPYFPNVTMGWDPSPRTVQSDVYINAGYPFTPILADNTPAHFQQALALAKTRLAQRTNQPKILTINAWNEWTEGSYLEPDTVHGLGYLAAIRDTFGA